MKHPVFVTQKPKDGLQIAGQQALKATLLSNPNPRVGCALVSSNGQLTGEGSTQRTGGPHAEVVALRNAVERGHATQGCTAYVTLEPCSHHPALLRCPD